MWVFSVIGWVLVVWSTLAAAENFGTFAAVLWFLFGSGLCFLPVTLLASYFEKR